MGNFAHIIRVESIQLEIMEESPRMAVGKRIQIQAVYSQVTFLNVEGFVGVVASTTEVSIHHAGKIYSKANN